MNLRMEYHTFISCVLAIGRYRFVHPCRTSFVDDRQVNSNTDLKHNHLLYNSWILSKKNEDYRKQEKPD